MNVIAEDTDQYPLGIKIHEPWRLQVVSVGPVSKKFGLNTWEDMVKMGNVPLSKALNTNLLQGCCSMAIPVKHITHLVWQHIWNYQVIVTLGSDPPKMEGSGLQKQRT